MHAHIQVYRQYLSDKHELKIFLWSRCRYSDSVVCQTWLYDRDYTNWYSLCSCVQLIILLCFCSVVFWFGDLNFRIDDLEMQVVKSAIDNNKFHMLWEKDQVKNKCCLLFHNDSKLWKKLLYMYSSILPVFIVLVVDHSLYKTVCEDVSLHKLKLF